MGAGAILAAVIGVAMLPLVAWAVYEGRRQYLEAKDNHHAK